MSIQECYEKEDKVFRLYTITNGYNGLGFRKSTVRQTAFYCERKRKEKRTPLFLGIVVQQYIH